MRRLVLLPILAASLVTSVSAQRENPYAIISEGGSRAGVQALVTPYATGGSWAAVPAHAKGSDAPTASSFRIRAWTENTGVRVLVFAVAPRADKTESETQIASIALQVGESREITETSNYNARPVTITASAGFP